MLNPTNLWFVKSKRAQSVDDYETWRGGRLFLPSTPSMWEMGEQWFLLLMERESEMFDFMKMK